MEDRQNGLRLTRRGALRIGGLAGIGLLGLGLSACGQASAPAVATSAPAAKPTTAPAAPPTAASAPAAVATQAAPAQAPAASAAWDTLLAAARKEGKVVVSGPPTPETRAKLPGIFKERFGIEMEYLGGNSSQLASRIQGERAAGQYSIDVSMSGTDTVYGTFLANDWLEPIKPVLILPEVLDPKAWPTGSPWFRDPKGEYVLQIFNTVQSLCVINESLVKQAEFPKADDLLDPKWKGKICSYDPTVNGGGLIPGSVIYITKGAEWATNFYKGQQVAFTRDYQQAVDWVAHGNYPIGFGITHSYIAAFDGVVPLKEIDFPDLPPATSGGFGEISLWKNAPHPNAAKVYVNWIASKEGATAYGGTDQSAPVRLDVDASKLVIPSQIPKPGVKYIDQYEYEFAMTQRVKIRDFYAATIKA